MPNFDPAQSDAAAKIADAQANQTYYDALARGSDAATALNAAKFAWQQKMDESAQTGMWNGQWNNPQEQWFSGQFGQWYGPSGGPQAGDQTMSREQQTYNQQQGYGSMYGQYYAPNTAPTQGQQTLQGQNQQFNQGVTQAGLTGYYLAPGQTGQGQQTLQGQQQQFAQGLQTEQEARAAQAQGQSQTMSYLNLLSNLRGPADWAKYQQVLGSTPGGMRDLSAAAMGQYVPGGGATTGMQPQAASLQSMMGDISGNPYYGQGGGQLQQPNVYQGGQGAYGQQQYQPQGGDQAWGSGIGIGQQQSTPQQQQQGLGGGANTMGQMPAPNQVAAQSWHNLAPSQQQMLLGGWESQGWDKNDVTALMNQALPKYTGGAAGVGSYRLQ